ncbi:MAG: prolyl-tRNA synthetase associated domain-containing protein [Pseudomonadota bacterium]
MPSEPNQSRREAAHQPIENDPRICLEQRLAELDIPFTTHEHQPVFTVAESEELHRQISGAHTKNLFLKDAKGKLFLVVASHETEVALKQLHKKVGAARFSFGKADLLQEVLGVTPGSVTAFAVMNDTDGQVQVVLDQSLMNSEIINAHPLKNNATTSIARNDLLRFLVAHQHDPTILDLTFDASAGATHS